MPAYDSIEAAWPMESDSDIDPFRRFLSRAAALSPALQEWGAALHFGSDVNGFRYAQPARPTVVLPGRIRAEPHAHVVTPSVVPKLSHPVICVSLLMWEGDLWPASHDSYRESALPVVRALMAVMYEEVDGPVFLTNEVCDGAALDVLEGKQPRFDLALMSPDSKLLRHPFTKGASWVWVPGAWPERGPFMADTEEDTRRFSGLMRRM